MNRELSIHVIEELLKAGVREFVLCPAARNAPLVNLIESSSIAKTYWYEERSAAFYALGRARSTSLPVAVVTTSGTAVGELMPAMMEAYYTSVPLIAITADRPKRYRGKNTPQTADQVGIFGTYATFEYDLEDRERCSLSGWNGRSPMHINVSFEEPGKEEAPHKFQIPEDHFNPKFPAAKPHLLEEFLKRVRSPLVIVSTLAKEDREAVIQFLADLKAPVYLEGVSGLTHDPRLQHLQVFHPFVKMHDGILRIGGVPTVRLWRDIEDMKNMIEVLSITEHPFSGSSYAPFIHTPIGAFFKAHKFKSYPWEFPNAFFQLQEAVKKELEKLLKKEPHSEAALVRKISETLPSSSQIYLGNSLPIREWDLCAKANRPFSDVLATRGLSGIDGQISCFFGLAEPNRLNVAILGDLTALYDFAGMWWTQQNHNIPFAIIVLNNCGGKIFAQKFSNQAFQNPHQLQFEHFAKFWKIPYQNWKEVSSAPHFEGLIEVNPDEISSHRFRTEWQATLRLLEKEFLAAQLV